MKLGDFKLLCFLIMIVWGLSSPVVAVEDYGKLSLGLSFGTAFLKGDYSELSSPGGMAWATLRHRTSDRLSHELSAGYVSLTGHTDGAGSAEYRAKLFGLDISSVISLDTWLAMSAISDRKLKPYLLLGFGVPRWSTDEVDQLGKVLRHAKGWGTNFFLGAGVEFEPSASLRLQVRLKGRYYFTDDIDLDHTPWFHSEVNDVSLESSVGLVYVLGKGPKVMAERPEAPQKEVAIAPETIPLKEEKVTIPSKAAVLEKDFIFDSKSIPSGERSYYVVQVAAWEDTGRAFQTADLMRRRGYPTGIESFLLEGETLYRVKIGPYGDIKNAEKVSKSLGKYGYNCQIDEEVGPWYVVRFASVKDEGKARLLSEVLLKGKYPAYIEPHGLDDYRIKVGPFPTQEGAKEIGRKIEGLVDQTYSIEKLE